MADKLLMTEVVRRHGYYDPHAYQWNCCKESCGQEGRREEGRSCRQDGTGEKSTEQERGRDYSSGYGRDWHWVDLSPALSGLVRTSAMPVLLEACAKS